MRNKRNRRQTNKTISAEIHHESLRSHSFIIMKHAAKHNETNKGFRVRAPWQDNILSLTAILSLLLLTLAAVVLVFWLFLRTGILSRDIFTQMPEQTDTEAEIPSVYDILLPPEEGGGSDEDVVRFSGDFSVLKALLADADTTDNILAEYETVLHNGTQDSRSTVRIYISGDCYRIDRWFPSSSAANSPDETYICDGQLVFYSDNTQSASRIFPVSDSFDMASLAGIPSAASYTDVPDEQTLSASYAEIEGEVVYFVRFYIPDASGNPIMQEYWISPLAELVIRCRTYAGAEDKTDAAAIYACTLKHTRALTEREKENLFVLPQ